jgi:hypothetical protein
MVRRRVASALVGALIASTFAVASVTVADTAGDPSDNGVQPVLVAGNPNCTDLNADNTNFPGVTQNWGFKLEPGAPNGTFDLDPPPGELTGGAAADPTNSITISNSDNVTFDWTATLGIDAVIVKAGPDGSNVYVYFPNESQADGGLHAPEDNGTPRDISHVEFCFDGGDDETPGEDPAHLDVVKFYDANANGINDDGQPITGWKVNVSPTPGDLFTPVSIDVAPGDYVVSEYTPVEPNWVHTTPTSENVSLAENETELVEFGNLCLGAGGGHTKGFWSNKNGQAQINDGGTSEPELQLLRDLHLRNADGTDFDPTTYAQFKSWISGATATNMANMLSAQLAAMALNVEAGFVDGDALIFAPETTSANTLGFATVNAVMAEADAALAADGLTPAGDPNRAIQEALKNALDNANNNLTFVQETPCTFTFADTTELSATSNETKKKKHRGRRGRARRR